MPNHSQQYLPPMEVESLRTAVRSGADSLRTWRELVRRALGKAGISAKAAAGEMGITEQQLSDQLNGREKYHLSFWRMQALGPDFWREMVDLILEFHGLPAPGLTAQDEEYRRIGKAYCELQQQAVRSQR